MDLCLTLLLLSPFLSAFASINSFCETNPLPNDVRFPRESNWYWSSSALSKKPDSRGKAKGSNNIETGEEEFEKAVKAISSLEISKSVELVFDPKTQVLIPTAEIPRKNQNEEKGAHDSAIILLSPKTYAKLKKVFENLKKEVEKGQNALGASKNFQTGRFKSKYFKGFRDLRSFPNKRKADVY